MNGIDNRLAILGGKVDSLCVTVQVNSDFLLPMAEAAARISHEESARYLRASLELKVRLMRIRSWQRKRRIGQFKTKRERYREEQASRRAEATKEFEGQEKPRKWWDEDNRYPIEWFYRKYAVIPEGDRSEIGRQEELFEVQLWMAKIKYEMEFTSMMDEDRVRQAVRKHPSVDHLGEIQELHKSCLMLTGSVLQVPSSLMRVVVDCAKEAQVELHTPLLA